MKFEEAKKLILKHTFDGMVNMHSLATELSGASVSAEAKPNEEILDIAESIAKLDKRTHSFALTQEQLIEIVRRATPAQSIADTAEICDSCNGSGFADATGLHACFKCNGRGGIADAAGASEGQASDARITPSEILEIARSHSDQYLDDFTFSMDDLIEFAYEAIEQEQKR